MNDVLVSYFPGEFGDWLRYFIAEHDGFERFTYPPMSKTLPRFNIDNEFYHTGIDLDRWNTLEEFKSQLIESNLRQVYKPRPWTHTIAHNPEDFDADTDWKYYDIARQTNMSIVFVKLNPLSELFETYIKRKMMNVFKKNVLSEEQLRYSCQKSYIHKEYPQHELNHVIEINALADYDEQEYNKLTTFLRMTPLKYWKSYVKKLEKVKL